MNGEKVGKGNKLLLQTGLEVTILQAKPTAKPRIRTNIGMQTCSVFPKRFLTAKISYLYQYCEDKSLDDLGNGPGKHYEILKILGR